MGNQQTQLLQKTEKNQQKFQQKVNQQSQAVSEIFQPHQSSLADRVQQALRISENERLIEAIVSMQTGNKYNPSKQICLLSKEFFRIIEDDQTIIQGVLAKWEPSKLFSQTSLRYCFLNSHRFTYNEDSNKESLRAGVLNFDLLSCKIQFQSQNNKFTSFRIRVAQSDKQFVFSSTSPDVNKRWIQHLQNITEKSFGRIYNLAYVSHYHRFWRKDYFSEQQFRQKAETGDIILMRGTSRTSVLQRTITQQQYDHIALIVKNIKGQILLFEANGSVGVGIMPWHKFIERQYYKQQQIIVYRKLRVNRTKQFFEQVQSFVQRNLGRKYKFSVTNYLLNRQSTDGQDKKTYFCSSLIAKLYKNLEILDQKISSIQYMPHAFSQKQKLALRQDGKYGNASLGNEHIIVFEKLFFQKKI